MLFAEICLPKKKHCTHRFSKCPQKYAKFKSQSPPSAIVIETLSHQELKKKLGGFIKDLQSLQPFWFLCSKYEWLFKCRPLKEVYRSLLRISTLSVKYGHLWLQQKQDGKGQNAKLKTSKCQQQLWLLRLVALHFILPISSFSFIINMVQIE